MADAQVSIVADNLVEAIAAAQAERREVATQQMVANAVEAALTAAQTANPQLDQKPGYGRGR